MTVETYKPEDWVPSWNQSAIGGKDSVSFAIEDFPELDVAEAHPSTGSVLDVIYALLHKFAAIYGGMSREDRIEGVTISRTLSEVPDLVETFVVRFPMRMDPGSLSVDMP